MVSTLLVILESFAISTLPRGSTLIPLQTGTLIGHYKGQVLTFRAMTQVASASALFSLLTAFRGFLSCVRGLMV